MRQLRPILHIVKREPFLLCIILLAMAWYSEPGGNEYLSPNTSWEKFHVPAKVMLWTFRSGMLLHCWVFCSTLKDYRRSLLRIVSMMLTQTAYLHLSLTTDFPPPESPCLRWSGCQTANGRILFLFMTAMYGRWCRRTGHWCIHVPMPMV